MPRVNDREGTGLRGMGGEVAVGLWLLVAVRRALA
jgi:hypothetical protein